MYIIKRNGKRYNSKTYDSYEAARKHARRAITRIFGHYVDSISTAGFSIESR